jgi:hypothetical protein
MTDPVQLLIDAGAIPSTPFVPQSRYVGVALAVLQRRPDEPGIVYLRRRFIPAQASIPIVGQHTVSDRDRPDLLAARYFGDALLFWRIADANAVLDPDEISRTPGRRILIPQAPGL